jgi:hypothetical protein
MNDWSPGYGKRSLRTKGGPILKENDFTNVRAGELGDAIGAGGNLGYLDGSVSWNRLGK